MARLVVLVVASIIYSTAGDPPVFIDHGLTAGGKGCVDLDTKCAVWASQGECQSNAAWMMSNCRRSCQSCQGGDTAWRLRTHIAKNYDNTTAAQNFSINTVYVDSLQLDHVEVDEEKQLLKAHGKIVLTWNDSRVMWDHEKWNINWLNFYWIQLWTPQLVQTNSPNAIPGKVEGKVLAANYTGQVYMWSDFSFTANCAFDYSAYPNDHQRCCFKLDDKRYFAVKFKVSDTARDSAQRSVVDTHVVGWTLKSAEVLESKYNVKVLADWQRDPYRLETSNCDVCVRLRRHASAYTAQAVAPAVTAALVTLTSFAVGSFWNQALFLLASLALQALVAVGLRLPPPAAVTAPTIVKFCGFNLTMTVLLLVACVALLNLSLWSSRLPPPHVVDRLLGLLQTVLPCYRPEAEEKLGDPTTNEMETAPEKQPAKRHWAPLCKALKYVLFMIYALIYLIVIFWSFVM